MITIIIPTYNNDRFLPKAIASASMIKCVGEIIIVDDASTDKTKEVIKKIKKQNFQIKYFKNKKNIGTGRSFIKGIYKSNFDYILMLNSDDFFIPQNIDKLFTFQKKNLLDLAYGKMAIMKNDEIFKFKHIGYKNNSYQSTRDEFIDLLVYDMYMPSFGSIIKKKILNNFYNFKYIDNLDKAFGSKFKAHDYDLFLNLSKKTKKIGFLNEYVCVWKPEENSQSGYYYFSSGCAAAESAFLFNRYYDKSLKFDIFTKSMIKKRILQKKKEMIDLNNKSILYDKHINIFMNNLNS